MAEKIPAPVISALAEIMDLRETHNTMDALFMHADAPGDPPDLAKLKKAMEWLRRINRENPEPLSVLGRLIEGYMEVIEDPAPTKSTLFGVPIPNPRIEDKAKLEIALSRYGLVYSTGGHVSKGGSHPSKSLQEMIKQHDSVSIDREFERAVANIQASPREAVSAACNILEAICKIYIEDNGLTMPSKMDLQSVWKVVRSDLGFEPGSIEDDDLKRVLSGMLSTVVGIGALRTHASSAHAPGRRVYKLQPRHARLAINAAHTVAGFILETWDERRSRAQRA